jgi:hypothetical protein
MKLFFKNLNFFLIPFYAIIAFYLIDDPFKVIWNYEEYYKTKQHGGIFLNKDHVSTSNYLNRYQSEKYNSFILGNSRSMFYNTDDWKLCLEGNVIPYHFDASGESIYGILKKLELLENLNQKIENALIILDYSTLSNTQSRDGHLYMTTSKLDRINTIQFQFTFFETFLNHKFFLANIDYKISGIKNYMVKDGLMDNTSFSYNKINNQISFDEYDSLININQYYTQERMSVFYSRDTIQKEAPKVIFQNQLEILNKIHLILKNHKTNYKIIINPLYDQHIINTKDFEILKEIFGKDNIHNFSGINEITNNYKNYYEDSHYRTIVCKQILNKIYKNNETN